MLRNQSSFDGSTLEHEIQHNGSVLFYEDPAWKVSSMAFAHILRDKDEKIVTINLTKINNLNETLFETYDEIFSISEDFKNSFENERQILLMRKMKRIEMKCYSTIGTGV